MSRATTIVWVLLVLIETMMFTVLPSHVQAQGRLEAIEPPEGQPGQELELTLWGSGFLEVPNVRLVIGGIDVLWSEAISDERILARISIPDNAPPGPRMVEVVAIFGENEELWARLEDGF